MTTLLAEAEQDNARLTQLNDVLKEEVRRQERSAEREQHLHNLEYMKNVIFKVCPVYGYNLKIFTQHFSFIVFDNWLRR